MSAETDPKTFALSYLAAVERKDFAAFGALLASDVVFTGPETTLEGASAVAAAYRRLSAMLLRNEPRKIFVDGDEICMIYDFVTDTSVGAVPTMEWLRLEHGKVRSIFLLTDHVRWPAALQELTRRSVKP
jgi:ketosteroid isomerase-like protein